MKRKSIALAVAAVTLTLAGGLGLVTVFGGGDDADARGGQVSQCLAWEQLRGISPDGDTNGVGRPVIDRLADDAPYGQLMEEWQSDDSMRLNYLQVIGTHNSYHMEPRPAILAAIEGFDADVAASLEYTHRPLDEQLDVLGMRQLEIDVFADPEGGLYATPLGPMLVGEADPAKPELLEPGLKVLHIQDIDFETRCLTFVSCLETVKAWSDAHPGHLPVMVLIEAKDEVIPVPEPLPPLTVPVSFSTDELDEIDVAIRSVFDADHLITPDDVRGERATLEEAVLNDGWPTLNESRGRVMFALINTDENRDLYVAGHPGLVGRVMFANSAPGSPEAAFVKVDEPVENADYISELVTQGYIVRTRADDNTIEARLNQTGRRDAALASGAQFVSTDYPEPDPGLLTGYAVELPGGGAARCNPVLSPPGCDFGALAEPAAAP